MIFQLLPDDPFGNVSRDPNIIIHPLRGRTKNIELASRASGIDALVLIDMDADDEIVCRHGRIRCVDERG